MTWASPLHVATIAIVFLAILGVVLRPWRLPEALWAVLGSLVLVVIASIPIADAVAAVRKGGDVYFFLTGMMLLAEVSRREGLFDWLAVLAVRRAKGSAAKLFALIYGVGTVVTIFLSNDATAVVLTPAVYAAAKHANAKPLPYLFVCAFVANAASFVLPISNPANLVVFGRQMPTLGVWLSQFGLASVVSIAVTYAVLRFVHRADVGGTIASDVPAPSLSSGARICAAGIGATAIVLTLASSFDRSLGLPTFIAGAVTTAVIVLRLRKSAWSILRDVSWSVLPLVAGLFVMVQAVESTGMLKPVIRMLAASDMEAPNATAAVAGGIVAMLCNLLNNLPLGLLAGTVTHEAHLSPRVAGALLIGVDLGPNLSVTGSLATVLWLGALRREGQSVGGWQFLAVGCAAMPSALIASLASYLWCAAR
jgi:arsenical pump membrane protein